MKKLRVLTILAGLLVTGCVNDPAPNAQMQLTEQAVVQASAVGADSQLLEMKQAQDNLRLAQKNMGEEDYKRARMLAEKAELDARLAEVKVLVAKSEAQMTELRGKITKLRKQLGAQQ